MDIIFFSFIDRKKNILYSKESTFLGWIGLKIKTKGNKNIKRKKKRLHVAFNDHPINHPKPRHRHQKYHRLTGSPCFLKTRSPRLF